ncbi:unnamed protein product, partial [Didymodactylos carnosus]
PSRVSTITFVRMPNAKRHGDRIPDGYAGFKWYNVFYMFEVFAMECYSNTGYANAFTNGRKCVAYNGGGDPISISVLNSQNTFCLHSFEAISVYREAFTLSVTGYRSKQLLDTKTITLTTTNPTLIEIGWERIDEMRFACADTAEASPNRTTFALTCLNLLL